jgi:hypothetical protein
MKCSQRRTATPEHVSTRGGIRMKTWPTPSHLLALAVVWTRVQLLRCECAWLRFILGAAATSDSV